jgi:hypothetical protein
VCACERVRERSRCVCALCTSCVMGWLEEYAMYACSMVCTLVQTEYVWAGRMGRWHTQTDRQTDRRTHGGPPPTPSRTPPNEPLRTWGQQWNQAQHHAALPMRMHHPHDVPRLFPRFFSPCLDKSSSKWASLIPPPCLPPLTLLRLASGVANIPCCRKHRVCRVCKTLPSPLVGVYDPIPRGQRPRL